MKKHFCMILLILMLVYNLPAPVNAAVTEHTFSEIDQYLQRSLKAAHLPGISVVIVNKTEVLVAGTYGNCPSIDTPFIIGSLSKSFTAAAILKLAEQGKISLDRKLSDYLPEITAGDRITIRQLLNHTSGLGEYQRLNSIKITDAYGTHQYANINYALLGKLIERITGESYELYVTEHIFSPLNMTHSAASLPQSKQTGLINGYRNYFGFPVAGEPDYPKDSSWGQVCTGYLSSSASDMGRYLQMYLNNSDPILSPESIHSMFYDNVPTDPDLSSYYGMGWSLSNDRKEPILQHSGLVENYMSDMFILPDSEIGVVFLANTNDYLVADAMFDTISESVAKILMGEAPREISPSKYLLSHLAINLLYSLILLLALLPLILLRNYKKRLPQRKVGLVVISLTLVHVFLPTAMLQLPGILITPLWVIRLYVPDLFLVLIVGASLLYLGGFIKLSMLFKKR